MKKFNHIITLITILVISIVLAGCGNTDTPKSAETKGTTDINISFVGDIMAHTPQIESARSGDSYDFSDNFQHIKEYIDMSDLALCNLETTFAKSPYTGYPQFSAPDILSKNIRDAGFDVAVTANNHMLDKGLDGLKRTIEITSKAGLKYTGTRATPEDKNYLITTVNGVKIGIVAATYETSKIGGQKTLNGSVMSDEASRHINTFNNENLDSDLEKYKESIEGARADGAQVIIAYFHWGEEYQTVPGSNEEYIAGKAADFGADIIFASHPHVLQKQDSITTGKGKLQQNIPVFYSMGNFISNQRAENLNNRYTEEGIIAQAKITYDLDGDYIAEIETGYIPTWVDKYSNGGKTKYAIIPLIDDYQNNSTLMTSGHLSKADQAREDIESIMGKPNNLFTN